MNIEFEPEDIVTIVFHDISEMRGCLTFTDKGTKIPVTIELTREHMKDMKETLDSMDL